MEITVSGRHLEVTPTIREYASTKAAKLPRYFDRIASIEVIVNKHNALNYETEIIVKAEHTDPFVVKCAGTDLYACIDDATHKLERRLTDHKERLRNRKHNV